MQFKHNSFGFTLVEAILIVVIIFILATIAVPASTAFRNKVTISSACETAAVIRTALAGYASANNNDAYPETDEAANWAAFRAVCSTHGATLAETLLQQGLSFFQYHGLDAEGSSCDNADPKTICSRYYIVMRVLNVHGDQNGAQLEINENGILRQTY